MTRGVQFHPDRKKNPFQARIQINNTYKNLGAHAAFLWMAQLCYGEFAPVERHPQSFAARNAENPQ